MADLGTEKAITDLVETTIVEAVLVVQSLIGALSLSLFPSFSADAPADIKTYLSAAVRSTLDIALNVLYVATHFVEKSDGVLHSLVEGKLSHFASTAALDWNALLKQIFDRYRENLIAAAQTDPDKYADVAEAALDAASLLGVGSRLVTIIFELFLPKSLNFMNWLGPTLAQFAGYDQIIALVREPQLRAAVGNLAEYNANSTFRTRAPEHQDAIIMRSRGLISEEQYQRIVKWAGVMGEFDNPLLANAYRAISPFILIRLFDTGAVTADQLRALMTFGGLRQQDQEVLIAASNELLIAPYQKTALTTVTTAYERGVISSADFDGYLQSLGVPEPARPIVRLEAQVRKLQQLDELYRKSISEGYKSGLISDADYVSQLESIGIDAADAEAHYAVDSIAKQGKALTAAERGAASAAAINRRAATAAAIAQYKAGSLDDAQLAEALLAAGDSPSLAALVTAKVVAQHGGASALVFGAAVPRARAVLMREQVAAIGEQVLKKLISVDQARAELRGLGIPAANLEALLAKMAAAGPKVELDI